MPVEHVNITDPEIHEPKGAASAVVGKVYVSDGAGSGNWRYRAHSHLYYSNVGTGTTITTPTSYTLINPTTIGDSAPHDFSHNSAGRLTYTASFSQDMSITMSCTFKHSAGSGVDCYFAIYKNGVIVPGTEHVRTANSANFNSISLNGHANNITTNDYFEVYCKCASGSIVVHALNLSVRGHW